MRRFPLAGAVLVFASAWASACSHGGRRPDQPPPLGATHVPDVKGKPLEEARTILARLGLQIGETVMEERDTLGYPPGTVIAQRPRVGAPIEPGATVDLKISAGGALAIAPSEPPPFVPANPPDVMTGPSMEPVPGAPPAVPFEPPPPMPTDAPPAPPAPTSDTALPSPGAMPAGWQQGTVPDLEGFTTPDAREYASRAGYEVYEKRVAGHPAGRVVTQEPAAGTAALRGSIVILNVSVGGDLPGVTPPTPSAPPLGDVLVPNVLDRTGASAHRILEDLGLLVREEATASGVSGHVMDQLPMAGERVPKGSEVLIRVANAEAAASPSAPPARLPPPEVPTAPPPAVAPPPPAPVPPTVEAPPSPPPYVAPPPTVAIPPGAPPTTYNPAQPLAQPSAPVSVAAPGLSIPADPAAPQRPVYPAPATTPPTPTYVPPTPLPPFENAPELSRATPMAPPPAPPPYVAPPPAPPPTVETPPAPPPSLPVAAPPVQPPTAPPPAPSTPGLVPPSALAPAAEATIATAARVGMTFSWTSVATADAYMIEIQEWNGAAWVELYRKLVRDTTHAVEIEPSQQGATDLRWRVRTAVGRKGSRPSAWLGLHLR